MPFAATCQHEFSSKHAFYGVSLLSDSFAWRMDLRNSAAGPILVANFIPEGIVLRAVDLQQALGNQVAEVRRVFLKLLKQLLAHGRSPILVDVLRHQLHRLDFRERLMEPGDVVRHVNKMAIHWLPPWFRTHETHGLPVEDATTGERFQTPSRECHAGSISITLLGRSPSLQMRTASPYSPMFGSPERLIAPIAPIDIRLSQPRRSSPLAVSVNCPTGSWTLAAPQVARWNVSPSPPRHSLVSGCNKLYHAVLVQSTTSRLFDQR